MWQKYCPIDENGDRYMMSRGGRYYPQGRKPFDTVWDIPALSPSSPERTGYPPQKPLALLRWIVLASPNPGDAVRDPFCGCATACIATELEGRQWVGIDIAPKVADLVRDRLDREVGFFFQGDHCTDIPQRTDLGETIRYNDPKNRWLLYGEQGGFCNGCETHFQSRNPTVDHTIPCSRGGTDHISNLQSLCGSCNSMKGKESHEVLLARLVDKGFLKRRETTPVHS